MIPAYALILLPEFRVGAPIYAFLASVVSCLFFTRHLRFQGSRICSWLLTLQKLSTNTALSMLKSSKGKSSVAEKSQNTNVVTYAYSIATKAHAWEIKLHKPMIAAGLKLDSSKINYDKSKKALSIPFRDHLLNEQGREFLGIWEFSPFVSKVTIDLEIERSFALARATKIKRKIVGSTVAVDTTYWNPVWRRSIEIDLG